MKTIKELEEQIVNANWKYWIDNNPDISDFEYDKLIEELRALDPNNKLINAFTYKGTEKKVIHSKPMLSLDKAYSLEEVLKWANKYARNKNEKFCVMPKYDGLSGKFENGTLSSRGDGTEGQDYTNRLPLIKFLTNEKSGNYLLGEMLITNSDFLEIQKNVKTKSGIPFKNQRNAAAGIIGCDDVEFYSNQGKLITFVDYNVLTFEVSLDELEKEWLKIVEKIQAQPYPMDGIVIKLADKDYAESLGCTEHAPRGAIAYKYTNAAKWSKLIGVEWSMGKDQIACIGNIEPIELTGITVSNVKLQLTKPVASAIETYLLDGSLQIGDHVLVERAGDIIPHIKESKPGEERTKVLLDKCPFCGGELEITDTSIKCSNINCKMKQIQGVYFAMTALNFKGVGEKYAKGLVDVLHVKNTDDLMNVTINDLRKYPNVFGNKMAEIFIQEQTKAKTETSLEKIFVSMNIPSIGENVSKLLLSNFKLDDIINANIKYEDLISIKGIGKIIAKDIIKYLAERKDEIKSTLSHFTIKLSDNSKNENGDRICFTGHMQMPRSKMEELANSNGMIAVDHVDKNTKYLVCADPNSNSSKLQKAKKLGCKIISEQTFIDMINI